MELDEQAHNAALEESGSLELDYRCEVNKLHLVKISGDFTSVSLIGEFKLKGVPGYGQT